MPAGVEIFISYSHRDCVEIASHLLSDLQSAGFAAWLDTNRLAGGSSWTSEIEEAIDGCRVVLALLSNGSFNSDVCRAEQLRALRKGKLVIPLRAAADAEVPLHLESKQYRDFSGSRAWPQ